MKTHPDPLGLPRAGEAVTLLPCPFCGGEAEIINIEDGENAGGSCACCTRCLASGNVEFERKENFVANWNRRALPSGDDLRGEVERLRAELASTINRAHATEVALETVRGAFVARTTFAREAIIHASNDLSAHLESFHDYEEESKEAANLRHLMHHLEGTLIGMDEGGEGESPALATHAKLRGGV